MDGLQRLRETPLPFAALLGIDYTSATPERVTAELTVRDDLCTRPAILHGGAIMAFADTLGAKVRGETTPVHRGRRTMVWQTRVTTEAGRLVALVTQTQMVLESPAH